METSRVSSASSRDEIDARAEEGVKGASSPSGSVRKSGAFEGYAKMFRILLASWPQSCGQARDDRPSESEDLILPSNEEWRYRVYYRLVQLQREGHVGVKRDDEAGPEAEPRVERRKDDWEWEPRKRGSGFPAKPRKHRSGESKDGSLTSVGGRGVSVTEASVRPGWRLTDILLAAKVLRKVQPPPEYSDEAEMRRVFGLVYDVLRYKKIFTRALDDTGFWRGNAAIRDQEKIVWLLLYDLQGRKFARPRSEEAATFEEREKIFQAAGLANIESCLLEVKTHLAASISRLRIRGSALSLDELLPARLRTIEGVAWGERPAIASGWINTEKFASKEEFLEEMGKLKLVCCEGGEDAELEESEYAFDPICPKMINLHESARETLAVSSLVRRHRFVFLERSLCLGAAALARAIRVGRLCGPVVLTHCLAPRHTGYLAELLADVEPAGKLLAFGAGERRSEYESYLQHLGVTFQRCRVFSEKYAAHPATSELERATVVLAVPSCSYTGVRDIVDLAVARGGDADLLESLTTAYADDVRDDDDDDNERNDRRDPEQWRSFLIDQMSTLKYALTRPNVQFVVYEVHTVSPSETIEMVREVVEHVNRMAAEKYAREHPRRAPKESKVAKPDEESREQDRASALSGTAAKVPDSDLFEVGSIDDVYGESAERILSAAGCFLAVIRRKEMTQFDSLFMIKVAESKGLFGDPKVARQPKPETEPEPLLDRSPRGLSQASARRRAKRVKIEIDRIMAHTYSSLSRSTRETQRCPRHERCASWAEAAGVQVSAGLKPEGEPWRGRRRQRESVNRLSTPGRVNSSRQKELRAIRARLSAWSEFDASFLRAPSKREESLSATTLGAIRPPSRQEWSPDVQSSTVLTPPIVARAARPAPLESVELDDLEDEEEEKERTEPRAAASDRRWPARRTSRLLHPVGSPLNVLRSLLDVL